MIPRRVNLATFFAGQVKLAPRHDSVDFRQSQYKQFTAVRTKGKNNRPTNMTLRCSCTAVHFEFFGQVIISPPVLIKVNFCQSQKTIFLALRTRGKDNRPKNRSLERC